MWANEREDLVWEYPRNERMTENIIKIPSNKWCALTTAGLKLPEEQKIVK
jgi:hypothetical protein